MLGDAHSTGSALQLLFLHYKRKSLTVAAICNMHCSTSKSCNSGIALATKERWESNEHSTSMTIHTETSGPSGVDKLSTPPVGIRTAIWRRASLYVRSTPCTCGACGAGRFPRHIATLKPHGRRWHATDTHLNIYEYTRAPHVIWASPHRQHHARHGIAE